MSNTLKRATGVASTGGAVIYTVPAGRRITLIGMRATNISGNDRTIAFSVAGTRVCAPDTDLPTGSAIDVMVGSKIVAEAGDTVVATADANSAVEVFVSFLEQVDA